MEFQQKLLNYISESLITSNETISIAESVTSGLFQLAFSQMPNACLFYKGGITTYTLEEKVKILHVNEEEASLCNCVSDTIADQMALGVAQLFDTDWSIAVTGYADPVINSDFKIFSHYAISYRGEIILSRKLELHPKTQPLEAQQYYTEFILGCFKSEINKLLICK
ncbi:CinA family protein [Chryseobacterium echinoideorum]|uniref:CinA family protein n=1 Tax=Chryseobacterium echinoideorum TaxID=1549648 RepID=UPI0011863410|nr:nicotinamide-nucleotide amidohydrolase family protein [Chryseobacterium echinoideorum]